MIALDTETTGLLRPQATELHLQPFIIEFAAAKFNNEFEIVDELQTFIKPPVPIPAEITQITNITNDMVADAPPFALFYDELCDFFLGEEYMFAHNCAFDAGMILYELRRMGVEHKFPWPKNQICTVEKSYAINNRRMNLKELHKLATGKEEIKGAHRAMNDVHAMIEGIKFLSENKFL